MTSLAALRRELREAQNPQIAAHSAGFFKSGPGEYAEGDRFRGIRVPVLRKLAKRYRTLEIDRVAELLRSRFHEDRLTALLIMVEQYQRADPAGREELHLLYLDNTGHVNNWDLVDGSAPQLVGSHLPKSKRKLLDRLAASESLWERRIAMLATLHYIRQGELQDGLRIARKLIRDEHDLIHKAVGWMLREAARHDRPRVEAFLERHLKHMSRTTLRYAIEHFSPTDRKQWLQKPIKS